MSKLEKNRVKVPYVSKDGIELPGVTTVLGILDKPALKQWAWNQGKLGIPLHKATEGALSVGTLAHYLIECFVKGIDPEIDDEFSPALIEKARSLESLFRGYWKVRGSALIHSELKLMDEKAGFGGTLDLIVDTPAGSELWDIKTSDKVWPEYYIQLAAYKALAKLNLNMQLSPRVILITKSEKLSANDIDPNVIFRAGKIWDNLVKVYHDFTYMKKML